MYTATRSKRSITSLVLSVVLCVSVLSSLLLPVGAQADSTLTTPAYTPYSTYAAPVGMDETVPAISEVLKTETDFGCFSNAGGFTAHLMGCMAALTYYLMFLPGFIFASLGSLFFNWVLAELVVNMSTWFNSITGIDLAWTIIRDLANIFLVFLTIFVGIAIILGLSTYGRKQMLWKIVLAALFLNFSGLLVGAVVDTTNAVAIAVYGMMFSTVSVSSTVTDTCLSTTSINGFPDECYEIGLAGVFWSKLKVTTVFNMDKIQEKIGSGADPNGLTRLIAMSVVGSALMMWVLGFVMVVGGFMLLGRFIALIFLLIVSPLALVAWITGSSSAGSQWWHQLLNQAIVAPALLLMWLIAFLVMTDVSGQITTLSSSTVNDIEGVAVLATFIIAIGFLVAGLTIAKKLGVYGATASMNAGRAVTRRFVGAYAGGAGAFGRQTVGRGARRLSNSQTLKNAVASNNRLVRGVGRAAYSSTNAVAGSSFDARGLAGKTAQQYTGGPSGKGGFNSFAQRRAKKLEDENKWVGTAHATNAERKERDTKVQQANSERDTLTQGTSAEREAILAPKRQQLEQLNEQISKKELEADLIQDPELKKEREGEIKKLKAQHQNINRQVRAADKATSAHKNIRNLKAKIAAGDMKQEDVAETMEVQMKAADEAEQQLAQYAADRVSAINKAMDDTVDARGAALSSTHLENIESERTGPLPTPSWKQEVVDKIRRDGDKKKRKAKDIQQFLEAEEKLSTGESKPTDEGKSKEA